MNNQPQNPSLGALLRRLLGFLGEQRREAALSLILMTLWTCATLAGPFAVRYAIDEGISHGNITRLNLAIATYIAISVITYWVYRLQIRVVSRVGEGLLRRLRVQVFEHLLRLPMPFYDRSKTGVLVSRMTSDVDSLQELVQTGLMTVVGSTLMLVISGIALTSVSWRLMLLCLIAVPFVLAASVVFARRSSSTYLAVRDRIATNLTRLQESITGVRVIQAFGHEPEAIDRFARSNEDLYDAHMASTRLQSWYLPVIEFAGTGTTALIVAAGGVLVHEHLTTIGSVTFFVLTLSHLFEPIQQFSQLFNQMQSAGAGLRKLFGLLDTPSDVPEAARPVAMPAVGAIELRDVAFHYQGQASNVLSHVNLTIGRGERIALVGPTGAGKSTLAKLIARLYDPTAGAISVGGVDLRKVSLTSLRERIVVVPQEGFLFNASIRENVRIGRPDATDAEVEAALERLGLLPRFSSLEQGLDTMVHERGSRLSAGEKQLVSLARAALRSPSILVLDEATSNLDPGTEALVERALDRLMEGRTVIVIAHRFATAARAHRIALVAEGGLAELGTHAELVAQGGRYAGLYEKSRRALS